MRYKVQGISRTTGDETSITVEAPSRQEAEKIGQRSLIVAEVELDADSPKPVKHSDFMAAAEAIWGSQGTGIAPLLRGEPPDYQGIVTGAGVLRVVAVLCYVTAGLCAVGLLLSSQAASPLAGSVNMVECGAGAIMNFVTGAVLHLLASLSLAVRDMARNSFGR